MPSSLRLVLKVWPIKPSTATQTLRPLVVAQKVDAALGPEDPCGELRQRCEI